MSTDLELATRLSNWGTADWARLMDRADLIRISEDCVRALDMIQEQDTQIEQLRAQLTQCRAEYAACIATLDRLENDSSDTRTDKHE